MIRNACVGALPAAAAFNAIVQDVNDSAVPLVNVGLIALVELYVPASTAFPSYKDVPSNCQLIPPCDPLLNELTELGEAPPPPVFTPHCHSKSPDTLGVILPDVTAVEFEPSLQLLVSTAEDGATL